MERFDEYRMFEWVSMYEMYEEHDELRENSEELVLILLGRVITYIYERRELG